MPGRCCGVLGGRRVANFSEKTVKKIYHKINIKQNSKQMPSLIIVCYSFLISLSTMHCTEKPIYVFPEMKLCGLVPIPTFMFL
jgi:hypothetical protein